MKLTLGTYAGASLFCSRLFSIFLIFENDIRNGLRSLFYRMINSMCFIEVFWILVDLRANQIKGMCPPPLKIEKRLPFHDSFPIFYLMPIYPFPFFNNINIRNRNVNVQAKLGAALPCPGTAPIFWKLTARCPALLMSHTFWVNLIYNLALRKYPNLIM